MAGATAAAGAAGKAGAAKGAAKAGGVVLAGGGPEDPVTDAIAIGQLAGSTGGGAPGATTKAAGAAGDVAKDAARKGAGGSKPKGGKGKKVLGWAWSDNRKLLTAEFVVCVAVLGLGTLVSPEDSKHDVPRAMIKGSALAGLFFVLALVSTGGPKPARVANALGTLVTATYVLTSADVHNLVSWVSGFFSPKSADDVPGAGGSAEGAGMSAGSSDVAA